MPSTKVAAGVDEQVLRHRLRAGAAERAVQHGELRSGGGVHALLVLQRQRAGLDQDQPAATGRQDAVGARYDLVERFDAGQHADDDVGRFRDRARRRGRRSARGAKLAHPLGGRVEADHDEARRQQIGRHRVAHDAQAEHADRGLRCAVHVRVPPQVANALRSAGRAVSRST
jgi:hypothetical protein